MAGTLPHPLAVKRGSTDEFACQWPPFSQAPFSRLSFSRPVILPALANGATEVNLVYIGAALYHQRVMMLCAARFSDPQARSRVMSAQDSYPCEGADLRRRGTSRPGRVRTTAQVGRRSSGRCNDRDRSHYTRRNRRRWGRGDRVHIRSSGPDCRCNARPRGLRGPGNGAGARGWPCQGNKAGSRYTAGPASAAPPTGPGSSAPPAGAVAPARGPDAGR